MLILGMLNFVIGIIVVFFTIIIFHPNNRYKKIKSKEDQLFLQKTLLTTIYFLSILVLSILNLLNIISSSYDLFFIELFCFNVYIIDLVLYNFFLVYELYSTFDNPTHYFDTIFRQKRYNYLPEFIIIIISIIVLSLDFLFKGLYNLNEHNDKIIKIIDEENSYYYCNFSSIFIVLGRWKQFIILILSLVSFILCIKLKFKISKFCFKRQEKLYSLIDKRAFSNALYLIYGIFYVLPIVTNIKTTENYNIFGSIFFLIILIQDYVIHISIIAPTKFCEYCLKKTLLGIFCACFYKPANVSNPGAPLVNEGPISDGTGLTSINDSTTVLDFNSNIADDKELLSMYKNGIFLDDYFLHYFDQILNIICSSIFKVYNSNYFSTEAHEQKLSSSIKIGQDVSCIGGAMQSMSVSNIGINSNKTVLSSESELGDDTTRFELKKNMEKDDLHRFKEVLEYGLNIKNNNNHLNVKVKSFFTPKCVESIYEQKIKGRYIAESLLSHMILTNNAKNKNPDNPNAFYWSLLAANGKEQYFNQSKNTSIKTFDKKFNLDIIDTNDEELIFVEGKKNNDLSILIDKYFTYINGKGIKGTFIPLLVGVFKVKINDFRTLLIFVTKNSLVENVPKNYFTYWQLIRFLTDKPQKLASSKITAGSLVKDDPIFERSFQIESKKDNPDYNKIFVKNYVDFRDTIMNDIEFLQSCGAKNFNLLLMYYEYESTQKHENQGAIKIKQTGFGTEIVEENIPKGLEEENMGTPINIGSGGSAGSGGFLAMDGGFFDDNDFVGDNLNLNPNNKNMAKLLDVNEKVNINSYEGVFDSFNCMCFFTFENVFDIRKRLSGLFNYHNFEKKVLVNFTEFKK